MIIYLFFEFINWLIHFFNYIQIIYPSDFFNKKDVVKKIIKRIHFLSKEEIEYLAKQLCKLSFFEPSKIKYL